MLGGGGSNSRRRAAYAIQSQSDPREGRRAVLLYLAVSVLCYRSRNANMASNSSMRPSKPVAAIPTIFVVSGQSFKMDPLFPY